MPLHEVVIRTSFFGQECINRYNYVSSGTPAAVSLSFGLASALGYVQGVGQTDFVGNGGIAPAITAVQSQSVEYQDILVRDVYDPLDFYTTNFNAGTTGAIALADQSLSPANAYGFRSNRTRLDIRRGFKRYVGATEANVQEGGRIVDAFLAAQLTTVADVLGNTQTYDDEGNTLTYAPVVVSKFAYTTPSGRTAYRYATESEGGEAAQLAQVMNVDNWSPYDTIRTQNSRQYGRGR